MTAHWTEEESDLARELLALPAAEFLEQVGRTKDAAKMHFKYLERPGVREKVKAKRAAALQKREQWAERKAAEQLRAIAPPDVIKDAIHRLTAPRSTTAWICGDPAPGRSALEKRA
jgi:hypothetical protein